MTIAYVLDEDGTFSTRCNHALVDLVGLEEDEEILEVRSMIERHIALTGSARGQVVLDDWDKHVNQFVKIIPRDYKRVLDSLKRIKESGLSGDEAIMAAFEANIKDVSRIGGS